MDPKVKAGGVSALLAAVIVTFILTYAPGLKELSDPLSALIVGALTVAAGTVAGYLKKAEDWAVKYVADHKASRSNDLP